MKNLVVAAIIIAAVIISGTAQAQTTGLCDTTPETFVSTNGMVQVRYNVKQVILTDMDGKTRTAYSYDYKDIPKLGKVEVEKAIPVEAIAALKDVPLKVTKELVKGYAGADRAEYEAKFNAAEVVK
jgi:hypothetical protein